MCYKFFDMRKVFSRGSQSPHITRSQSISIFPPVFPFVSVSVFIFGLIFWGFGVFAYHWINTYTVKSFSLTRCISICNRMKEIILRAKIQIDLQKDDNKKIQVCTNGG